MVNQTKQRKLRRSTSKKMKSRTRKHANRRVSRSNKMRGGGELGLQPNQSFNRVPKPLLSDISVDFPVNVLLPEFADTSNIDNIEVYYSDSLPESDTSLWTPKNKVFTTNGNKRYQTLAYNKYIPIIKNNILPVPNQTYNFNPRFYDGDGDIKFTLSFYGIHKQTNLPILLMTKEDGRKGYLFAKLL